VLYKAQAEINARIADAEAKEGRTIWICQMLYDIISLILYISIASFRSYYSARLFLDPLVKEAFFFTKRFENDMEGI
jgi:hypothetical protein